jgi:hypothetical protein
MIRSLVLLTSIAFQRASGDMCSSFCIQKLGTAACGKGSWCKNNFDCQSLFWTDERRTEICVFTGASGNCYERFPVLCTEASERLGSDTTTMVTPFVLAVADVDLPPTPAGGQREIESFRRNTDAMLEDVRTYVESASLADEEDVEIRDLRRLYDEFQSAQATLGAHSDDLVREYMRGQEALRQMFMVRKRRAHLRDIRTKVFNARLSPTGIRDVERFRQLATEFEAWGQRWSIGSYTAPIIDNNDAGSLEPLWRALHEEIRVHVIRLHDSG